MANFEDAFLKFLIRKPPNMRKAFEIPTRKGKIVGNELEFVLETESPYFKRYMQVENLPLLATGETYLLVDDAAKKFKISPDKIRYLCRKKRINCSKRENGWWMVNENSLRTYIEWNHKK